MRHFLLSCSVVILVACSSAPIQPAPVVVTKIERVVTLPPPELLTPPPAVAKLDVEKASQADVAGWILQVVQRMRLLDQQLLDLAKWAASTK